MGPQGPPPSGKISPKPKAPLCSNNVDPQADQTYSNALLETGNPLLVRWMAVFGDWCSFKLPNRRVAVRKHGRLCQGEGVRCVGSYRAIRVVHCCQGQLRRRSSLTHCHRPFSR